MPKVFIKTDSENRITAIDSSVFLADPTGWTQIDKGEGDRYTHAQGNYFPMPLMTENGVYRYKFIGGRPVERTAEEMAADDQSVEPSPPTLEERLEALEAAMLDSIMGGLE